MPLTISLSLATPSTRSFTLLEMTLESPSTDFFMSSRLPLRSGGMEPLSSLTLALRELKALSILAMASSSRLASSLLNTSVLPDGFILFTATGGLRGGPGPAHLPDCAFSR